MLKRRSAVHDALIRFDFQKRISRNAIALAKVAGKNTERNANAGRTLVYYHGLIEKIVANVGKPRGKSFLHIAGATGVLSKFLQERGARAVSFDFDSELNHIAQKMGVKETIAGDALERLPFKNGQFDCLVTDHFAFAGYRLVDRGLIEGKYEGSEHLLREAIRVLKPNGVFIINSVDARISPDELIKICSKYFGKVEPYAYAHKRQFIPGVVLSHPLKKN